MVVVPLEESPMKINPANQHVLAYWQQSGVYATKLIDLHHDDPAIRPSSSAAVSVIARDFFQKKRVIESFQFDKQAL